MGKILIYFYLVVSLFLGCSSNKKENNKENALKNKNIEKTTDNDSNYNSRKDTTRKIFKDTSATINNLDIENDIIGIRRLLDNATINMDIPDELNHDIMSINQTIKSYPPKIIDSLKFITKTYIDYQLSLCLDANAMYLSLLSDGKTEFEISDRTNKLVDILTKTPLKTDILKFNDNFSKLYNLLKKSRKVSKINKQNRDLIRNKLKQSKHTYTQSKRIFRLVYNSIFKS